MQFKALIAAFFLAATVTAAPVPGLPGLGDLSSAEGIFGSGNGNSADHSGNGNPAGNGNGNDNPAGNGNGNPVAEGNGSKNPAGNGNGNGSGEFAKGKADSSALTLG